MQVYKAEHAQLNTYIIEMSLVKMIYVNLVESKPKKCIYINVFLHRIVKIG